MTSVLVDAPPSVVESPTPVVVADDRQQHRTRLGRRRRAIGLGVAALVGLAILDPLLGALQHGRRQEHLAVAFAQPDPRLTAGDARFVLQIPSIHVNQVVIEGAGSDQLRSGPGRVLGTSLPGAPGNTVILGHTSRYGGPFGELSTLTAGARIALKSRSGYVQLYRVTEVRTVGADDTTALARSRKERLTLVASADDWWPDRRVVVTAEPDTEAAGPPAVPVEAPRHRPAPGALDDTPLDLRALLALLVLTPLVIVGARRLAGRYRPATVGVVVVPAAALMALSVLHVLDAIGPSTW